MLQKTITSLFIIVGLINFVPIIGAASGAKITQLYAVGVNTPELELLLRHRAVLLGIIGAFLIVAAFVPHLQFAAMLMAMVSMTSFIAIMTQLGSVSTELSRVASVDWFAIFLLSLAFGLWVYTKRTSQ